MARSVTYDTPGLVDVNQQLLFRSITEQLKTPLLYIARQAELSKNEETVSPSVFADMQSYADMAVKLVDSYLLGLDVAKQQTLLEIEPVPLSAVLYDVAQELAPLARQRNTSIELHLQGKYGQVMANRHGMIAALYSLGAVLSEVTASPRKIPAVLRIAAHRTPHGIVSGIYIDGVKSFGASIRRATTLHGNNARSSFTALNASASASVFIADSIFSAMETRLRVSNFRGNAGLAVTLQPSTQLQLV